MQRDIGGYKAIISVSEGRSLERQVERKGLRRVTGLVGNSPELEPMPLPIREAKRPHHSAALVPGFRALLDLDRHLLYAHLPCLSTRHIAVLIGKR